MVDDSPPSRSDALAFTAELRIRGRHLPGLWVEHSHPRKRYSQDGVTLVRDPAAVTAAADRRDKFQAALCALRERIGSLQPAPSPEAAAAVLQAIGRAFGILGRSTPPEDSMLRALADEFCEAAGRLEWEVTGVDPTEPPTQPAAERTEADEADGKADGKENSGNRIPKNPAVLKLARMIRANDDPKMKKIDFARDITDGDETRAQSLLRKLRDFPHLLDA